MELKEKLLRGDFCVGTFLKTGSLALIELMGAIGMDYVLLDMEHSPFSIEELENQIRAAEVGQIVPFVRVSEITETAVLWPLDKGARGLLFPNVGSKRMAEKAIHYSKFSTLGMRGIDVYARAAGYGLIPKEEYLKKANDDTIVAVQIEAQGAIENLNDILTVQGIDIIYIGPYDLSQSLGIPGQIDHPKVTDRIRQINQTVLEANKFTGLYVDDVDSARKWVDAGIQFITLSVDVAIYGRACRSIIEKLK